MEHSKKYQIGTRFYNYRIELSCAITGYSEELDRYLVCETRQGLGHTTNGLWKESDIDHVMGKQDSIVRYAQECDEKQEAEAKKQQFEADRYNDVNGYCDTMTELQRGKVLKALNKSVIYKEKIISRKELINNMLNDEYTPEVKENIILNKRKERDYYVMSCEDQFLEITKTEYDYASYLLELVETTE